MTTTPTIWKAPFFPNPDPIGTQRDVQIVGTSLGYILTLWADNAQGLSADYDIVGVSQQAEGISGSGPVQLNQISQVRAEMQPQAEALPDGGFVLVYGLGQPDQGSFIYVERFDSNGNHVSGGQHAILDSENSLANWQVEVDGSGNYTVVFERLTGSSQDVHSITYDFITNTPGPERTNLAQNSGDNDTLSASDAFVNGHIVTLTTDPDDGGDIDTVEFTITDPATGNVVRAAQEIAGEPGEFFSISAVGKDVAVLTGGQIVMAYTHFSDDSFGYETYSARLRICSSESPGSAVGPEIVLGTNHVNEFFLPEIRLVALLDGGFFAIWEERGLTGQRYAADGTPIGQAVRTSGRELCDVSLTSDGRILVAAIGGTGEPIEIILDPRESIITGGPLGEVLTTQAFATDLSGAGGDDSLLGQDGNDDLHGGTGKDTLIGGKGADHLHGDEGLDRLLGGLGNDTYFLADANATLFPDTKVYDEVTELFGQGVDTVVITALDVARIAGDSYTLGANIENGRMNLGTVPFVLNGNELDNTLLGDTNANRMFGALGNDAIDGDIGDDTLGGDAGNDALWGQAGRDQLFGGGNADQLYGGIGADTLDGGDGADRLDGGNGRDRMTGGNGRDIFTFNVASGEDTVLDFTDDADTLNISAGFGFANPAAVVAVTTKSGSDAVITLSATDQIVLKGFLARSSGNAIADLLDDITIF